MPVECCSPPTARWCIHSSAFEPNVAGVFDTRSGAELAGLNGALYGGFVAEFSADGSKLVTATGRLNVFDVATLRGGGSFDDALLREIDAHDSAVLALGLSPDGTMAVTDDREDPLKLWDLDTGRLLGEFGGTLDVEGKHLGDFHPTRPWLLVTTPPNAVRIHTLDIDELIEIARSRLSRQMSEAECTQYFRAACPTS